MLGLILAAGLGLGTLPRAADPVPQCACRSGAACGKAGCPALGGTGGCGCRVAVAKPRVVVYLFTMRECPPCKAYAPRFVRFADLHRDDAAFVRVDVERPENAALAARYAVTQVPRVVVTDGEYYTKFNGAPMDDQLSEGIQDPSGGQRATRTLPTAD